MSRGRAALATLALLCAAQCTAPNPAFMMETPCEAGARQCVMAQSRSYPVVCGKNDAGQLALLQERCPLSAECQAGICRAPAAAKACTRQRDCQTTEVCVPLVGEGRTLTSFCLPRAVAERAPRDPCTTDQDCQSYLCLPFSSGHRCLKTCASAQDCEIPDECRTLNITVTGVAGMIQSCQPRS